MLFKRSLRDDILIIKYACLLKIFVVCTARLINVILKDYFKD